MKIRGNTVGTPMAGLQVHIGSTEPQSGPVLWFNTAPREAGGAAVLALSEDAAAFVVRANVEGTDYGVKNATVWQGPTAQTYDFTVL